MTEDNKQDTSFPSGGSRTEYIGAKVTVEQKQYIRRLAAECGMTVSSEKKGADATITVTSGDGLVKTTYKVQPST